MKRMSVLASVFCAMSLFWAAPLSAQFALTKPPAPWFGGGGPPPPAYEVLPDRRINFHISAPTATSVQLEVGTIYADLGTYEMKKDVNGVWSVTVGPVTPEFYPYAFKIGGATVNAGLVNVPGNLFHARRNVPHGAVITNFYHSTALSMDRDLVVYVPPQYASEPSRRFPVLYLWAQPGPPSDPWLPQWVYWRRANNILDNLIAEKKAVPMIVVMMDVRVPAEMQKRQGGFNGPISRAALSKEFGNDIVSFVDRTYRTLPGRDNRALAGVSGEGATTFETVFDMDIDNLQKVGNVGLFGTGLFGGTLTRPGTSGYAPFDAAKTLPPVAKRLTDPATRLKVFYLSVGALDPRKPYIEKVVQDLGGRGVKALYKTLEGGHQDKVWRESLNDFAPLLFK